MYPGQFCFKTANESNFLLRIYEEITVCKYPTGTDIFAIVPRMCRRVCMTILLALTIILVGHGTHVTAQDPYAPVLDPANFVQGIAHPYFSLTPGTTFIYEGEIEDSTERIEVSVLHETKQILRITCTVVQDTVWVDGELVEGTFDWFAQDRDGNVWYMGEDSKEYEDGVVVSTAGSWEAGVDGAQPYYEGQSTGRRYLSSGVLSRRGGGYGRGTQSVRIYLRLIWHFHQCPID